MLISFEGGEGSGKSTHVKMLAEYFTKQGKKVIITREPGGTKTAEKIREILLSCADLSATEQCFLNFAARAHHVENLIKPALKKGNIVITDRFFDSTYVYQGAAQGMAVKTIKAIHKAAIGTFKPDVTIILDIDPKAGMARTKKRGDENHYDKQKLAFHQSVRKGFLDIAKKNKKRCVVINADQTQAKVAKDIIKALNGL